MDDDDFSVPSSPADANSEDEDYAAPRRQVSRRQSTRGRNKPAPEGLDPDNENEADEVETPLKAGQRSSGRQRKTPKRHEGAGGTPSSTRRAAATPRSTRAARSAQKPRRDSVDEADMDVDEHSPQPTTSVARARSRRSTAKTRSNGANAEDNESPPPDDYHDGLDDLLALQLQQGFRQEQPDAGEPVEVAEPLPEYVENLQTLCQEGLQEEVRLLTTVLSEKLSGKRQIPLKGLESEYNKVNHLVEQTVTVGEGNSMLLLGSRGSGKTAVVETIISNLARDHNNEFHVVRLNGFLHTDDRLALREMWRQLGRETNTEDDAVKVSSYADTMATLLALLSHPEELFGTSGNGDSVTAAKSIVILLDEFDLFVTHPRQTLLYNLFDIAQARKAPIAVIGLTTKVDVTEMLEKRVKSRFSHRYVYMPLPRSFEVFSDICMASLDLDDQEITRLGDTLGSERAILEGNGWKTLLEGWKVYLQVRTMSP